MCTDLKTTSGTKNAGIGNGVCNDEFRKAECEFDLEDCCSNKATIADIKCDINANNGECSYDGGDCCIIKESPHNMDHILPMFENCVFHCS